MSQSIGQSLVEFQRRDIVWTDRNLAKTPFHTAFWVHKRIRESVAAHAPLAHGVLLDVGCGLKPYKNIFAPFVETYYGTEYNADSGYRGNRADVASDAAFMPFADECVDTILCTEVLEHVADPERVVGEFARILKPGGIIITTAPFFYPIHDEYDFFRYTDKGIAAMMQRHGLKIEKIEPLSGTGLTIAVMLNIYLFDIGFMWTKWLYPFGLVLRPVLWILIFLLNCIGWLSEKIIPSKQMAFNHLTIGKKI